MPKQKYTVVSLFSGGMGLDLGLEQTGRFRVVACVEKEHAFCETIRTNHRAGRLDPDLKIFEGDISLLSPQKLLDATGLKPGEIDLLPVVHPASRSAQQESERLLKTLVARSSGSTSALSRRSSRSLS